MAEFEKRFDSLAERTEEAAARVHASMSKTTEKLESQIVEARAAADKTAEQLKAKTAGSRDETSQRWSQITQEWHDHVAKIQSKVDVEKQDRAVDRAEHRAERAEADALDAIDFAYLATEWAESAALDAALARKEADELAATHV